MSMVEGYIYTLATTLVNNVIADNQAGRTGSGLYTSGHHQLLHTTLLHTTIARNHGGDGSGIYLNRGNVALTNTILVSHTVGITVAAGNTATLNGVLWYGNAAANTGGAGAITVTNAIIGDPVFMPDGYHIAAGSAAFNTGVDSGVRMDIDHHPRPYQIPDLGADEYWPPGTLKYIYLPLMLHSFP